MINQVLHEIQTTSGALNMSDLSRKLSVDRTALDGMIQFLVRKGRLVDDDAVEAAAMDTCASGSCGGSCPGPSDCTFVAKMPKTYSVSMRADR
jgi:hypothetical protein